MPWTHPIPNLWVLDGTEFAVRDASIGYSSFNPLNPRFRYRALKDAELIGLHPSLIEAQRDCEAHLAASTGELKS